MQRADISPLSPEDTVRAIYEAVLRRPPDDEGLALYAGQLRSGESLAALLAKFLDSPEFRGIVGVPAFSGFHLDGAPPMHVETQVTAEERQKIWTHIASVWSSFGETDPFWSVLTNERWRAENMDTDDAISAFYATGDAEVQRLDAWLNRNGVALAGNADCVEYGCGLGRITNGLSRRFGAVTACDISAPHLSNARTQLDARGIRNVRFQLVRGEQDLPHARTADLFYSVIVLQHNPPPVMLDILSAAFASLRPGGVAFFQVPTYALDYSFTIAGYWDSLAAEQTMEMHFLPQRSVLELGRTFDVFPLEVQADWCVGNPEKWISSTFLMRKAE